MSNILTAQLLPQTESMSADDHIKPARQIMEILLPLAILVLWIVLQAWVLPRFGVKT
jgi:hypothetical protein